MVEPAQPEGEAVQILVLASGRDRFLHGREGLAEAAEVGLEDGLVKEGVLIEGLVACGHGVVKVAVQVVKGGVVIPCSPGIEESKGVIQCEMLICFLLLLQKTRRT